MGCGEEVLESSHRSFELPATDVEDITLLNKNERTGPDPDKFDGRPPGAAAPAPGPAERERAHLAHRTGLVSLGAGARQAACAPPPLRGSVRQ
jgi:hypothetical protein